ncbi:MAG: UPF0758 domain-containing protein [Nitrospirota bacterium]
MAKKPKQTKLYEKAIKNWPVDDMPREKLFKSGEHTLSNTELIAILLRRGIPYEDISIIISPSEVEDIEPPTKTRDIHKDFISKNMV